MVLMKDFLKTIILRKKKKQTTKALKITQYAHWFFTTTYLLLYADNICEQFGLN